MPHAIVSEEKRRRAKTFRRVMTTAERKLWYALRAHRFEGLGFRRQVPLGRYVLDLVCHDRGLIIEVDGGQHFSSSQAHRDRIRDRWLNTQGYRVVRIANDEVLTNLEGVVQYLMSILTESQAAGGPAIRGGAAGSPLPPCGGARSRSARSEGGDAFPQAQRRTPLPTLPHKGGGVLAEPAVENSDASTHGGVEK
jgi:very-short-patch-repair endonuclease